MTDRLLAIALLAACTPPRRPPPPPPPPDELSESGKAIYCGESDRGQGLCYEHYGACRHWHKAKCTIIEKPRWVCKYGTKPTDLSKVDEECFPTREMCERIPAGAPSWVQSRCVSMKPVWCSIYDFGIMCFSNREKCDGVVREARKGMYSPGHEPSWCFRY